MKENKKRTLNELRQVKSFGYRPPIDIFAKDLQEERIQKATDHTIDALYETSFEIIKEMMEDQGLISSDFDECCEIHDEIYKRVFRAIAKTSQELDITLYGKENQKYNYM